jgi:hypothetical protein
MCTTHMYAIALGRVRMYVCILKRKSFNYRGSRRGDCKWAIKWTLKVDDGTAAVH